MATDDCRRLMAAARRLLEQHMYDGDEMRDDVAELCMKLDEVLLAPRDGKPEEILDESERAVA